MGKINHEYSHFWLKNVRFTLVCCGETPKNVGQSPCNPYFPTFLPLYAVGLSRSDRVWGRGIKKESTSTRDSRFFLFCCVKITQQELQPVPQQVPQPVPLQELQQVPLQELPRTARSYLAARKEFHMPSYQRYRSNLPLRKRQPKQP